MGTIGFDANEIEVLINDVNQVKQCVDTTMEEISTLLKDLTSDEVFKDCEYRDVTLAETKAKIDNVRETVVGILDNASKKVDLVGQKAGVSVSKNIMSIEDQNAAIKAAMAKVQ
jgi:hypothetical protein